MNEQLVNIPNAGQLAALLSEREGRGIQGLFHSTAVDTTLYSLFTFNSTLDGLLRKTDVVEEVQRSLRDGVVTPLRTQHAVGAKRVVQFRLALMKACTLGARSLVEETGATMHKLNGLLQLSASLCQCLR